MIRLNNIEKVYRTSTIETIALSNVNLDVPEGAMMAIMGPSGCGKSTLLNMIGLLDSPTSGTVEIAGEDVRGYSDGKLANFRNRRIGFIFQSYHLINDLNVVDNVELPLLYRRSVSARARRRLALEALEKVGLSARTKHLPSQLSGGQKQRVAIARAIVGQPDIILADEPTGNLDSRMGHEILDILTELNETDNATIVMVTHDESMATRTQQIIRLFDGTQVV